MRNVAPGSDPGPVNLPTVNLSPIQQRALRNAAIAGVATALVGFTMLGILGGGGGGGGSAASTSPASTPTSPPIGCANTFETVPSVDPSKKGDALFGVTALASDDAWAVGDAGPRNTLIEHWDGTSWVAVASPNGDLRHNVLNAVAGMAPGDVWAVGGSSLGAQSHALIERWDGVTWSVVPAPSDAPSGATLTAVAAIATDDAWAVGASGDTLHGNGAALIMHWNGIQWSVIPGASLPVASFLSDVAPSGGEPAVVWAVGYDFPDATSSQSSPLIERWDGTSWVVVPNAGTLGDSLHALGVAAPDAIWAVGSPIQRWDGQSWKAVGSGKANPTDLNDVAVLAPDDLWAVGSLAGFLPGTQAMIEHFDGQRWSAVRTPQSHDSSQTLAATAAFSDGGIWAVGSRVAADGSSLTLILTRTCGVAPQT